jgi:xanthine/uracil permease
LATVSYQVSGAAGGTGVVTTRENIGATVTKTPLDRRVFVLKRPDVLFGFSPKFGALIQRSRCR